MPTAFVASYRRGAGPGDRHPRGVRRAARAVAGRRSPEQQADRPGRSAGHGCGHHLFGAASVGPRSPSRTWLEQRGAAGTLRVYGTPAEEGGSGKVYMVRDGLFKDVDVVAALAPGRPQHGVGPTARSPTSAASSASAASPRTPPRRPSKGRSALDGVEAMNYMVNMMREHVPQETRIHYVITNGGDGAERRARLRRGLLLRAPSRPAASRARCRARQRRPREARRSAPDEGGVRADRRRLHVLPNEPLGAVMDAQPAPGRRRRMRRRGSGIRRADPRTLARSAHREIGRRSRSRPYADRRRGAAPPTSPT